MLSTHITPGPFPFRLLASMSSERKDVGCCCPPGTSTLQPAQLGQFGLGVSLP